MTTTATVEEEAAAALSWFDSALKEVPDGPEKEDFKKCVNHRVVADGVDRGKNSHDVPCSLAFLPTFPSLPPFAFSFPSLPLTFLPPFALHRLFSLTDFASFHCQTIFSTDPPGSSPRPVTFVEFVRQKVSSIPFFLPSIPLPSPTFRSL